MRKGFSGAYLFIQAGFVIMNISCATSPKVVPEQIDLKYPVLFVHGSGFRDKTMGVNYWGRIPKTLQKHGVTVYYGGTDAWGSVEYNGNVLKDTLDRLAKEQGVRKVNIIAHSRGGLEARYLISTLRMDGAVASLTTVSTPHRGVKAMDLTLDMPGGLYKFSSFFVNLWFRIAGDKHPDFYTSSRQLSARQCRVFNEENKDRAGVYYQSYAALLKHWYSDFQFIILEPFIKYTDGGNDGLCPVESAVWGDYRGLITSEGPFGISHAGVVDGYRVKYKGMDIPGLYVEIVRNLAEKGY